MSSLATAVVASAAIGAYSSNKASKRAQESANKLSEQGDAAAQLGRDQFDWYKQEYENTRGEREATAARDAKIAEQQYASMNFAMDQAKQLDQRNKSVFQPLEDEIVSDAKNFDAVARGTELAGRAKADVNQGFSDARGQAFRSMARMGVNPNDGKFASMSRQGEVEQSLALAGAGTTARRQATDEGYAKKMDAVALGKGIIGNQATMQQISQNGGSAAVSAGGAGLNASLSGSQLMGQGFGSAMQGYQTMSGLYSNAGNFQRYGDYMTGQQNQAMGAALGVGALKFGGADAAKTADGIGKFFALSDETKKKKTGKPADTEKALDEVMQTPVQEGWEYDESKGAPAGSGGKQHIGPMAQQVRVKMGDAMAPGGKAIDLVSMNGRLMASMQELGKRVKKLESEAA